MVFFCEKSVIILKLFKRLIRLLFRRQKIYKKEYLKMKTKTNRDYVSKFIIENREGYYRLAYTYVKNQQDALDIVQEAICKALESQHKLKNPDGIKSWFYKIVVHTALDFLRKSNKIVLTEDEILEDIGGSSSDNYEDTDLMSALDRLSDENKTIVVLRYFESMKLQDIASIMNMPESTVKTKLYSSLKKLRIELE